MEKKRRKREHGVLSLEASISLTAFLFMMLFLYSIFIVFEIRNEMAHVTLATANSLSLDGFQNKNVGASGNLSQIINNVYGAVTHDDSQFTDYRQWYDDTVLEGENGLTTQSATFSGAIKDRFLAYLTGGDLSQAEEILDRYHVVGGVSGLDFSGSRVESGKLYVVVRYTLQYEFHFGSIGTVAMEQSACSKIWQ